jgi:hypothetical protein
VVSAQFFPIASEHVGFWGKPLFTSVVGEGTDGADVSVVEGTDGADVSVVEGTDGADVSVGGVELTTIPNTSKPAPIIRHNINIINWRCGFFAKTSRVPGTPFDDIIMSYSFIFSKLKHENFVLVLKSVYRQHPSVCQSLPSACPVRTSRLVVAPRSVDSEAIHT